MREQPSSRLYREVRAKYQRPCRQAFADVYAEQAQQMAERMAKLRSKERDKREGFRKHVLPFVPGSVLAGLGLQQQPPHCQISLPAQPRISPPISTADLQKIPTGGASLLVTASPQFLTCWVSFRPSKSSIAMYSTLPQPNGIGFMSSSVHGISANKPCQSHVRKEGTSLAAAHRPQSTTMSARIEFPVILRRSGVPTSLSR